MRASLLCALLAVCVASVSATFPTVVPAIDNTAFAVKYVTDSSIVPQAITFTPDGSLVINSGGCTYVFPNAVNLPNGAQLTLAQSNGCLNTGVITNFVASQAGNVYTINGFQINLSTGALTQRWNDCGATHGIAIDPRDGAVFVSSVGTGFVWRVGNPDTHPGMLTVNCSAPYFDTGALSPTSGVDGITLGPDGTFFAAAYQAQRLLVVSAWSPSQPVGSVISYAPNRFGGPDGISICFGNGTNYVVTANEGFATVTQWILDSHNVPSPDTLIAHGLGGYLDFTAVDPRGCIWGTNLSGVGVYRVTNSDFTCGCNSPQKPHNSVGSCPDCTAVQHLHFAADAPQSSTFHSDSKCATIAFDA